MTELPHLDAWQRGAELALRMIESLGDDDCYSLDPSVRDGPQVNAVFEYLERLRAIDDRNVTEGFGAILTDWIASASGVDLDVLRRHARA